MRLTLDAIEGVRIAGAGVGWPSGVTGAPREVKLDNEGAYAALLGPSWQAMLDENGWDPEHPMRAFGVRQREWARGTQITTFDIGLIAARLALRNAAVDPKSIDLVLVATCTPPHITKNLAARLAQTIGTDAAAIDIRAGGAGGLDALITAAMYLRGGAQRALVIATETASHYLSPNDLGNGLLFGDGAAALVLTRDDGAGGLAGAVLGNATVPGQPFSVPGTLPPDSGQLASGMYRFSAPDGLYRESLAKIWELAGEALRDTFPAECSSLDAFLPYAVTREQVQRAAGPFDASCDLALQLLENHGCLGCAGPLVGIATQWLNENRRRDGLTPDSLPADDRVHASLAVAGGVSWSAVLWRP